MQEEQRCAPQQGAAALPWGPAAHSQLPLAGGGGPWGRDVPRQQQPQQSSFGPWVPPPPQLLQQQHADRGVPFGPLPGPLPGLPGPGCHTLEQAPPPHARPGPSSDFSLSKLLGGGGPGAHAPPGGPASLPAPGDSFTSAPAAAAAAAQQPLQQQPVLQQGLGPQGLLFDPLENLRQQLLQVPAQQQRGPVPPGAHLFQHLGQAPGGGGTGAADPLPLAGSGGGGSDSTAAVLSRLMDPLSGTGPGAGMECLMGALRETAPPLAGPPPPLELLLKEEPSPQQPAHSQLPPHSQLLPHSQLRNSQPLAGEPAWQAGMAAAAQPAARAPRRPARSAAAPAPPSERGGGGSDSEDEDYSEGGTKMAMDEDVKAEARRKNREAQQRFRERQRVGDGQAGGRGVCG